MCAHVCAHVRPHTCNRTRVHTYGPYALRSPCSIMTVKCQSIAAEQEGISEFRPSAPFFCGGTGD